MLYSEIEKFGVVVAGEQKRSNGSGWQKYYVATTDYDKCTHCSLRWGHRGACILEDTVPNTPRGAKVAAAANLSSGIVKLKRAKPTRVSSHKKSIEGAASANLSSGIVKPTRVSSQKSTELAGLLLRLRGEDSDSSVPPTPCQYLAVEVGSRFQQPAAAPPPPPSPVAAVPSMQDFLKDCKLDSYTEVMLEDGFDDVEFLAKHERNSDNNLEKMLDAGDFPITKPGHVMKLVYNLRKLSV